MGYLVLAGVVFGVNLLTGVGPPTWAVLVFFRPWSDLAAVPLVLIGALAAASGRLVLGYGSRRFRNRLSPERIANLEVARDAVAGGPKRARWACSIRALAVAVGPAVRRGWTRRRAAPTADRRVLRRATRQLHDLPHSRIAAKHSLGSILQSACTSPRGIRLQLLMLAGLVALPGLGWTRILTRRRGVDEGEHEPGERARRWSPYAERHNPCRSRLRTPPAPSRPPSERLGG